MKNKKITLILLLLILCVLNLNAQEGKLDLSFAPVSGADASIQKMALQNDGKIIIVGSFTKYDGIARTGVARINSDGTLDPSFDPGTAIFIDWGQYARAVDLQSDGKILMGGTFTNYNNNFTNRIVRINTDGSYDPSFNATNVGGFSGINGEVDIIKVQPDGKILVGGPFAGSGTFTSKNIIRLKPDGAVDSTFVVNGGANSGTSASSVSDIALQPDGKIIIVGNFGKYGNTTVNNIARLNINGSLDTTFQTGSGTDNHIQGITLQTDGKIVISGFFHTFNKVHRWNIARLNSNGTLDTSFTPNLPSVPASFINCNAVQDDGKVIVPANRTRLYSNGLIDTTDWHNGAFAGGGFSDIIIQPDGNILISGTFVSFDGTTRNRILRLLGTTTAGFFENTPKIKAILYPNPVVSHAILKTDKVLDNADVSIVNCFGQTVKELKNISGKKVTLKREDLPAGLYFIRITENNKEILTKKIIVAD